MERQRNPTLPRFALGSTSFHPTYNHYKFDAYQKGIDGMVGMSITIIIATATVAVLPSLSPVITAIINAVANGIQ